GGRELIVEDHALGAVLLGPGLHLGKLAAAYVGAAIGLVQLLCEALQCGDARRGGQEFQLVQVFGHLRRVLLVGDQADEHRGLGLVLRIVRVDHSAVRNVRTWSTTSSTCFLVSTFL